jgi:hypothetical protein
MRHRNPRRERRAKEAEYRKERKKAHKEMLKSVPQYPTPKKQPTDVPMQRRDLQQRFEAAMEVNRNLEKKLAEVNALLADMRKKMQAMQLAQGAMARVA